jgi:hydroxyacylglutathione hydrolase
VLFRQFVDDDLGCASYLIGDEDAGVAFLVDPAYAIEPYLEAAERHGVRITRVLETHTHADHVSGHGRLALDHGVAVAIHPDARPDYPFEPLEDGAELLAGAVSVRVLHTPGHRPEHVALVTADAVLTGDSLFVGAAARPDLAVDAREGAQDLFHSLCRLAGLPESYGVYPGHVAGSLCGAGMSSDTSSTIGRERRSNPALAHHELDGFVDESASVSTPRPPNVERIVALNRGPFVGAPEPLRAVGGEAATVLDVRPVDAHLAGHVPGAFSVPVAGGSFGTKAGFVLKPDEQIVVHASSPAEADVAARKLRAVGFLELEGYLADPDASEHSEPVEVDELERLLEAGTIDLVDVRDQAERDGGYIPGSRHVPFRLMRALGREVGDGTPIVTICESGARAAVAASILAAAGVDARPVVHGGIRGWQQRGNRTVSLR